MHLLQMRRRFLDTWQRCGAAVMNRCGPGDSDHQVFLEKLLRGDISLGNAKNLCPQFGWPQGVFKELNAFLATKSFYLFKTQDLVY